MINKRKRLYGKENNLDLKVVIALNRATNALNRRANGIFRSHGLTMMQFAVLEVLYHKGDLKIGQIIEKILSTGGNMTVVINNLEKEGMVKKLPDPSDSRASIVCITQKGAIKVEEIFPEHVSDIKAGFEHLSHEEKEALIKLLKKVSIPE